MALKDYVENKPVIESERLLLRTLKKTDIEALKKWMPDMNIYTYWGKGPGKTDKNPELLFQKDEKKTKSIHLGIELKSEECVIGEVWVYLIENNRMAKLAIRIGTAYQRNGYATEAINKMIDFCFEKTELRRLWTDVDVRNTASCRLIEKSGFKKEGTIRQGKMVSTWCDYHIYGLLKEDVNQKK